MNINIEYIFINTELNEMKTFLNNTIKDYIKKYGNSYWRRLDYKYYIQFFDKIKSNQKILQTNKM